MKEVDAGEAEFSYLLPAVLFSLLIYPSTTSQTVQISVFGRTGEQQIFTIVASAVTERAHCCDFKTKPQFASHTLQVLVKCLSAVLYVPFPSWSNQMYS